MGLVRIVGGALRGRRIRVPDLGVRPTSERAREAIFDVLGPKVVTGARVLDLYAGSGALGIEALSRGAIRADFVEKNRVTARVLRENLTGLDLAARSRVYEADLSRIELPAGLTGPFDLAFLDPPYAGRAGALWLERLSRFEWPEGGGLIVYERSKGAAVEIPPALLLATERTYSETTVAFFRVAPG